MHVCRWRLRSLRRRRALAQQVTKETVPGVTNFARLETTVACAGATKAEAVPEIKKMGFASIINLRLPANRAPTSKRKRPRRKRRASSIYNMPFNGQIARAGMSPTSSSKTLTTPGNEPAYIHCASGNRAAAMWMIKRLAVDHWDADRAATEATALGLTSPALKQFAIDYSQAHKR